MRNGFVLYSFSVVLPAIGFFVVAMPKQLLSMSTGLLQLIAAILFLMMNILSGICIHFKSDIGLFVTQLLLSGIPGTAGSLVLVVNVTTWYREIKVSSELYYFIYDMVLHFNKQILTHSLSLL